MGDLIRVPMPATDRRAPQGTHQGRPRRRRRRQDRRAQPAPRRQRGRQEAGQGQASFRRRPEAPPKTTSRRLTDRHIAEIDKLVAGKEAGHHGRSDGLSRQRPLRTITIRPMQFDAAPRRDRDGRQRPLGQRAASCRAWPAISRASTRCRRMRQGLRRARRRGPDACSRSPSENWNRPRRRSLRLDGAVRRGALTREVRQAGGRRRPAAFRRRARRAFRQGQRAAWQRGRNAHRAATAALMLERLLQLRRPLGHGPGRTPSCVAAAKPLTGSAACGRAMALAYVRGPGSAHPHRRRAAHQQLPAVAAGGYSSSISPTCCGPTSTTAALDAAIAAYQQRERRFGQTSAQFRRTGDRDADRPCVAGAALSRLTHAQAARHHAPCCCWPSCCRACSMPLARACSAR